MLALASLPLVAPQPSRTPLVMLVYPDGTVEFTSSYSGSVEPSGGVSTMTATLGVSKLATGSRVELTGSIMFEGDTLISLASVFRRFNVGALIYPNGTRILIDFSVEMVSGGIPLTDLVEGQTIHLMSVSGRADISGQTIDATIQVTTKTDPLYTADELNSWIETQEATLEPMIASTLAQMGLQVIRIVVTPTAPDTYTSEVNVNLVLQGNLTQIAEQGGQAQVVFNPFLILGVFVARPDDLSTATLNFSSSRGTLDIAVTLNYRSDYDALINANRLRYLDNMEAIAEQDPTNGNPWLPLISLLKPAQLTASQAGFNLQADFDHGTMTWSSGFPKMKVGQVTGNTLSLKQFLDALGPADQYTMDESSQPTLDIAIRGVEDASNSMEIVVPAGAPTPSTKNATTAVWEGIYIDQLDDVSFILHPKDAIPPTIAPGIAPGAALSEKRPTLSAALSDNVAIDVSTIMVKVDGIDVTASATTSATSVSYTPTTDLQDGPHTFYIKVKDTAGNPAELTVNFTVSSGIPMVYLLGGGAVLVVIIGVAAFFLLRKKPSVAQGPPPPPPA
jgi:hypothetical protein